MTSPRDLGWGFWAAWLALRNLPYMAAFVSFCLWLGWFPAAVTALVWTLIAHYEAGFDRARRAMAAGGAS